MGRPVPLHWQTLIALTLAVPAGLLAGTDTVILGVGLHQIFDFVGALFLNALKMLIVPLIVASIISGIARLGPSGALGRLGGKTLLYFSFSSLIAILIGLFMVNLVAPGLQGDEPVRLMLGLEESTAEVESRVGGRGIDAMAGVFLNMVPANIVAAAAEGQMLGLIFFSLVFGYFLATLPGAAARAQVGFWEGLSEVMMRITDWVMKFAPIGVFALVAKVVATTGFSAFVPLAWFTVTVIGALALHVLVALPLLLIWVGRVGPLAHYRAMAPALVTAFSTASSSATLPITMDCVERRAGVSNQTSSFVLPLGATVNMDGTALYECVAALFIAQAYGLQLGFAEQFGIVVLALVTSIGVAGIPSASLVAIAVILGAFGLPLEGLALILAVDRILDMLRTAVNVLSDSCGAVVIGRLEGEQGILRGLTQSTVAPAQAAAVRD